MKLRSPIIKPMKVNHTKSILNLLATKSSIKTRMFDGNPTEFFRKIRMSKKLVFARKHE